MNDCPWSLKDVGIVFLYAVVLFFVFCFWMTVAYFLANFFAGESAFAVSVLRSLFWAKDFAIILLFYLALLAAMKMKIIDKYGIKIFDYFVVREQIGADIVYGIKMYLKFIAVLFLAVILLFLSAKIWDMVYGAGLSEKINIFFKASELEGIGLQEKIIGVFGFVTIFILGPFFEELFFRGCLYRALRRLYRPFLAILISSFIFALLHGYFFLFLYVFLIGILLAQMYEKRRSLIAPLTFHMLNNLVVIVLFLVGF